MADDLAPFFESRETRNGRLPPTVRTNFESASAAAEKNGEAAFQDKQYVSLWLSQRVGLPRNQILSNFDSINERFFGTGATPATAYDAIAKDYAVSKPKELGAVDPAQYDTKLDDKEEADFGTWKERFAPNDSGADYDLRGAYKAGLKPGENGHWPDTFKKPNHPTFSVESIYAKDRPDLAGSWDGDEYLAVGMPRAGKDGFLYNTTQAGRSAVAGFSQVGQSAMGGIYSQAASITGPALTDPTANDEYLKLKEHNARLETPYQFTSVYDEDRSFGPVLSDADRKRVEANEARMSEIVRAGDTKNREAIKQWSATYEGDVSKEYRDLAKFWYDLSDNAHETLGVNPAFQKTMLGQFMTSAGSVPATAALAAMGFPGAVAMEGQFFAGSEQDRIEVEGARYDPQRAFAGNLVSSLPQMALERAFGVERLMNDVLGEVPKFAGKVKFGDYAKNFVHAGLTAGAEEGITEPAQGFWNDYVASLSYDEKRETLTGEGAKRRLVESVSAFALGALFGGGISAVSLRDQGNVAKAVPDYLTAKDDLPLKPADFNGLRQANTDEEIKALAPNEETGRILLAATNGDAEAQAAYNAQAVERNFVKTDGVPVDGLQLEDVNGVPVVQMEDGASFALDLSQEEDRAFFNDMKAAAAVATQAEEEIASGKEVAAIQQEATEDVQPEAEEREQAAARDEEQSFADKAIAKLESMKFHQADGQLYAANPLTIAWDSALDTAILAIKGGKALSEVLQTAVEHFREKYGQEDAETENKITEALTELMAQRAQAQLAGQNPTVSAPSAQAQATPSVQVPASPATIKQGLTGIPQNAQQALQAQAQRLRAKKLAATAALVSRINAQGVPQRSKAVRASQQANILSRLATPINSRLASISKELGQRLRRFEYDTGQAIAKDFNAVQPFLVGLEQMPKQDAFILDFALKNGDKDTRDALLKQHGLTKEFAAVEKVLAKTRKRAVAAGYEVGEIEDYFPRKVKDLDGLMTYYYGRPDYGVVEKALAEAEKKANIAGRIFTLEDRMEVVNSTLQGNRRGSAKPGNLKARTTEIVSQEANVFYADSTEALLGYIDSLNQAIEKRKFFGKFAVQAANLGGVSNQLALEQSIGAYVENLIAQGEITRTQQREVTAILEARFSSGVASDAVNAFKSLSYITTMGHLTSAVGQLQDVYSQLYTSGFFNTLVASSKAFAGKSEIKMKDVGLEAIAEEFRDTGKMQKILNGVFKAVGIHYLDRIGKEGLMNAKFRKMQQEAASGKMSQRTREVIAASFTPQEQAQVTQDLAAGKKTENTLFLTYSVLADYQPINRSEYPEYYLRHPNGRIFYMLKSFTLKQIDVFRREGIGKIVNGNAKQKLEGFRNLAHLSALMLLAGVPLDWLKDFVMGRNPVLGDIAVDNIFKLIGVNRWALWQFRERKDPVASALLLVAPPAPFLMYPVQDMFAAAKAVEKGEEIQFKDFETWRALPFIGAPIYWWGGGGAKKVQKRKEQQEKKDSGGGAQKSRSRRY